MPPESLKGAKTDFKSLGEGQERTSFTASISDSCMGIIGLMKICDAEARRIASNAQEKSLYSCHKPLRVQVPSHCILAQNLYYTITSTQDTSLGPSRKGFHQPTILFKALVVLVEESLHHPKPASPKRHTSSGHFVSSV